MAIRFPRDSEQKNRRTSKNAPVLHKKHVHKDAEEVIYILSGKGQSGIRDTETEMCKGDTMFVPRGMVHWFYNPFDEPVEMIFIYTRPSLKSAGYKIVE